MKEAVILAGLRSIVALSSAESVKRAVQALLAAGEDDLRALDLADNQIVLADFMRESMVMLLKAEAEKRED